LVLSDENQANCETIWLQNVQNDKNSYLYFVVSINFS